VQVVDGDHKRPDLREVEGQPVQTMHQRERVILACRSPDHVARIEKAQRMRCGPVEQGLPGAIGRPPDQRPEQLAGDAV
jgi:hypothetical protein